MKKDIHINIAPLVDVMLVLLIIFMVTAPMMQTGIDLDLPTSGRTASTTKTPVVVSITAHGRLYVGEQRVSMSHLGKALKAVAHPGDVVQLKADKRIPYERVFEVIQYLVEEGFSKVSLMADAK